LLHDEKNLTANGPFHTGMSAVVQRGIVNYETGVLGAGVQTLYWICRQTTEPMFGPGNLGL